MFSVVSFRITLPLLCFPQVFCPSQREPHRAGEEVSAHRVPRVLLVTNNNDSTVASPTASASHDVTAESTGKHSSSLPTSGAQIPQRCYRSSRAPNQSPGWTRGDRGSSAKTLPMVSWGARGWNENQLAGFCSLLVCLRARGDWAAGLVELNCDPIQRPHWLLPVKSGSSCGAGSFGGGELDTMRCD